MATHEMKGDLVRAAGDGMSVAHCVSADFAMGAGIARQLDDAFGIRTEILREFVAGAAARIAVGDVIELRRKLQSSGATISIYNLVTKKTHRDLPTYDSFERAIAMLKKACAQRNQGPFLLLLLQNSSPKILPRGARDPADGLRHR